MIKPEFYSASDYAWLTFNGGDFYYGYEHTICAECGKTTKVGSEFCDICEDADRYWCFVASFNKTKIVIPFPKLGAKNMFNVVDCLIIGIGLILTKYKLIL